MGRHLGFFSSGLSSFYACRKMVEENGSENCVVIFCDTKYEAPDNYRFAREVREHLGCEFLWIEDGRDPYEVFVDARYFGNTRVAPCSRILKFETSIEFVEAGDTLWFGIDWTEDHRIQPIIDRYGAKRDDLKFRFPLAENPIDGTLSEWSQGLGIESPSDYSVTPGEGIISAAKKYNLPIDRKFRHANCNQGCVKAGLGHYALLWFTDKERYMLHENNQQSAFARAKDRGFEPRAFLRLWGKGRTVERYVTLKEYREEFLEEAGPDVFAQLTFEDFADGPCVCMS